MFQREKIDETFINDADPEWSKKLNTPAPMIAILVTLVLAILFSLAWRDHPVQGREEPSSARKSPPKA
jgi:hypothetical protein